MFDTPLKAPDDVVERVAIAIRRNRFERTGRGSCFDPTIITDNERDDARAAIDAMADGWQDISTAPKRTKVLVYCPDYQRVLYLTDNEGVCIDNWRWPTGEAACVWPTHWRALPEPPA